MSNNTLNAWWETANWMDPLGRAKHKQTGPILCEIQLFAKVASFYCLFKYIFGEVAELSVGKLSRTHFTQFVVGHFLFSLSSSPRFVSFAIPFGFHLISWQKLTMFSPSSSMLHLHQKLSSWRVNADMPSSLTSTQRVVGNLFIWKRKENCLERWKEKNKEIFIIFVSTT